MPRPLSKPSFEGEVVRVRRPTFHSPDFLVVRSVVCVAEVEATSCDAQDFEEYYRQQDELRDCGVRVWFFMAGIMAWRGTDFGCRG